jgi:hypothetical protein
MTKHIAPLPNPAGSLLLRELNHRVNNEFTSTICMISANAVKSDDVAVKAALLDVVDLLHGCADARSHRFHVCAPCCRFGRYRVELPGRASVKPTRQFCYFSSPNADRTKTLVDLAIDRKRLPSINEAVVPNVDDALSKCQWFED